MTTNQLHIHAQMEVCEINYLLQMMLYRAYMCGLWPARSSGAVERRAVIKKAPSIIRKLKEDFEDTR